MIGFVPMVNAAELVAVVQVPPTGLQTPSVNEPPANGMGSAALGIVILRVILDWFTIVAWMFVSNVIGCPIVVTTPTLVI